MSTILSSKSNTKSRKGCSECKRKRVKCDEAKPVCSRCQKSRHSDLCDYNLKLSWTQGRPFKKRRTDTSDHALTESSTPSSIHEHTSSPDNQNNPGDGALGDVTYCEAGNVDSSEFDASLIDPVYNPETRLVTSHHNDVSTSITRSDALPVQQLFSASKLSFTETQLSYGSASPSLFSPSRFEDVANSDSLAVTSADTGTTPSEIPQDDESECLELVRSSSSPSATIPPSLSTYPLLCPSESPNAYFFLHHYSIHTATTLFPLLPAASRDSVLSVAASSPSLLSALLAISAAQYGKLRGDSDPDIQNRAAFFSRKALTGLQKTVADPVEATTFPTICTVLALATNDVLMSGNVQGWKTHLLGAERLLTLAIGSSRDSADLTDPSKIFLVKWFAALDLFAGMSSLTKTLVPDGRYWSLCRPSPSDSIAHIDSFVGFSLELIPLLSRISRLARLQQRKTAFASSFATSLTNTEVAEDLDAILADNVAHTEAQLLSLVSRASSPSIADAFPAVLAEEMQDTHALFVYAALLHLYRRVQELPKHNRKPEFALSKIIEIVKRLRPESPASIVILWPLFSAGCETDDVERRRVIWERMVGLRRFGMGNVDQALVAMQGFWNTGGGERWDVFLGSIGVDLVLF